MLLRSLIRTILIITRNKKLALNVTNILLKVSLINNLKTKKLVSAKL